MMNFAICHLLYLCYYLCSVKTNKYQASNMLELTCHRLLCIFTLCASLSMFATIVGLKIPKCNIAEKIAGTHLIQTFYFYLPEHFLLQ